MSSNTITQGENEPARLPLLGNPVGTVRASLHSHHLPKWGFLLYRCDYRCDADWESFMATLHWNLTDALSILNAVDLAASLDLRVVSNQSALDGASVDGVRDAFKAWVTGTEAKEELKDVPIDWGGAEYPRYKYCVHVDADAVDSVVKRAPQPPEFDRDKVGYVHLVRLYTREITDDVRVREEEEDDEEDEEDNWDEFVLKVPVSTLFDPEPYGDLYDSAGFDQMRRRARAGFVV